MQRARAAGFDAHAYPLFMTTGLPWTGPEPHLVDAVMFTSANAARLSGEQLYLYRHLPAFAVGGATAQAVAEAGFASVTSGNDGVKSLLDTIAARGHDRVLHISGRDIRTFDPKGLRVVSACVYAAVEIGNAEDLLALLTPGMALLVHSPRAGERLEALVPVTRRSDLHVVAISEAALALCGTGWASVVAARSPRDDAMLALAAGLCK
ncbi:uroporphyrinogen-III synthase [Sphingobium sp. SCG-1]|uniref:uroporphyrinogen-III synthase n=1 Tax=Sphingobium sp. SCG-1 TaxID=2072936 RepID=UPI001CB9C39D|nr:uroporphyrinogen-III synthase [Sphingobium sp. SCG-1]